MDLYKDIIFTHGPLDVLDHASDSFSFGGKAGIDATIKHSEENQGRINTWKKEKQPAAVINGDFPDNKIIKNYSLRLFDDNIPILIIAVNPSEDSDVIDKAKKLFRRKNQDGIFRLILAVDHTVDPADFPVVTWQVLGNTDPYRDHEYLSPLSVFIDGTIKAYRKGGFPRKWPNVVCSDNETILTIDRKWKSLGIGNFITSPSGRYSGLCRAGSDEIIIV